MKLLDRWRGAWQAGKEAGERPWRDMRLEDDSEEGGQGGGGVQYLDPQHPEWGAYNTTPMATPPPDTHGRPYEEMSHYEVNHLTGENTDPRGNPGGDGQSGGGFGQPSGGGLGGWGR